MPWSLTRLLDPDTILRSKIVEFVSRGDFGLASGLKPDGSYERVFFKEDMDSAEVTFESGVFLLLKAKAIELMASPEPVLPGRAEPVPPPEPVPPTEPGSGSEPEPAPELGTKAFRIHGDVPPEIWNRLGTKILPKLRSAVPAGRQDTDLKIGIDFSVTIDRQLERTFEADLRQILEDLGLTGRIQLE